MKTKRLFKLRLEDADGTRTIEIEGYSFYDAISKARKKLNPRGDHEWTNLKK